MADTRGVREENVRESRQKATAYGLLVDLEPRDVEVRVAERGRIVVYMVCEGEAQEQTVREAQTTLHTDAASRAAVLVVDAPLARPVTACMGCKSFPMSKPVRHPRGKASTHKARG